MSRSADAAGGKVTDAADRGAADGVGVRLWTWPDNARRQWRLEPAA
ncbi:RICIN domain-containing protein [Thermomonospora amylolytica]|nr:RICIN domain-containing protein [Thermomonospora amylolytica]